MHFLKTQLVIDALSRYIQHHIILIGTTSRKMNEVILALITSQLAATPFDFNIKYLYSEQYTGQDIRHDHLVILDTPIRIQHLLQQSPHLLDDFCIIELDSLTTEDSLQLLKSTRHELERYHQVLITEESIEYAHALAHHYLGNDKIDFDNALAIIDSAAARAKKLTATVTNYLVAEVVSDWTQIPLTHLQSNKFKAVQFAQELQRHIHGQEIAISMISDILQRAYLKLIENPGPLANFLLVGATGTQKSEIACQIAKELFGHEHAFIRVNSSYDSKALIDAVKKIPYAVLLFENIEKIPNNILLTLAELFSTAYFHHTIVIMTTTLSSDLITSISTKKTASASPMDLIELILNKNINNPVINDSSSISTHEILEKIMPVLTQHLPNQFLHSLHVIPFLPLDQTALEQIIHEKLLAFTKRIHALFDIELTYAREIIKFIALYALRDGHNTDSIDKLFDHYIATAVANELVLRLENKNSPKRLLLQLHELGQSLCCVSIPEVSS